VLICLAEDTAIKQVQILTPQEDITATRREKKVTMMKI
jgi:hypothetical protein